MNSKHKSDKSVPPEDTSMTDDSAIKHKLTPGRRSALEVVVTDLTLNPNQRACIFIAALAIPAFVPVAIYAGPWDALTFGAFAMVLCIGLLRYENR